MGAPETSRTQATTEVKTLTPDVTLVGYNGRRGDGTLQKQGWSQLTGGSFTPIARTDDKGGYVLNIVKNAGVTWEIKQPASERPGDMIRHGGRLYCRFRLKGAVVNNRYAFAFYLRVPESEIPSGVTLALKEAGSNPFLASFAITTANNKITLCQHQGGTPGTLAPVCDYGTFDNDWHTLELIYPGNNTPTVTPVLDGMAKSPVSLCYSTAKIPEYIIDLMSITAGTVYELDVDEFSGQIYRDDGKYRLTLTDDGNRYYFAPAYYGGMVTIPDERFPQGFCVEVIAEGSSVTIHPESNLVLLQPKGDTGSYPVSTQLTGSAKLIQTGINGKTWALV
ncbi:hypothetical protein AH089_18130 [Salmonella enterica subsp. enterica serovar Enteritidis]|nr:hypothetical protein [Salmonella enterica subsp. enterica serovar Enteritidis]